MEWKMSTVTSRLATGAWSNKYGGIWADGWRTDRSMLGINREEVEGNGEAFIFPF